MKIGFGHPHAGSFLFREKAKHTRQQEKWQERNEFAKGEEAEANEQPAVAPQLTNELSQGVGLC